MRSPWRRLQQHRHQPAVSVVVPVHNVEEYLAECLDSLLGQTFDDLEIVAVDDGSTDGSLAMLQDYAARDHRVRVLTQANAGQGAARNAGVAVVRGEFLMFVDSDDVVPRDALETMVATLRRTGSDFCVGAAQRYTHRRDMEIAWGRLVHDRDRLATTLDEFPDAMLDIIACNRLFRTAFWRDRVPPFEAGVAYEDHVPMLVSSMRAQRFDVLARVVYRWRIRTDGSSTSQQKASLRNLQDRIAVKEQARRLLQAEASPLVLDAWVARTVDIDFQPFLRLALSGDDAYRAALQTALRAIFERASDRALERMRFAPRVRAWLAARGDWAALEEADAWFRDRGNLPRGRVEGERLVADFDQEPAFLATVPARMRGLADHETPLSAVISSARWRADGIALEGYVLIRGLDTSREPPQVEAWLASSEPGTGACDLVPLPIAISPDDRVDAWAADGAVSYRHGRFATVADLAALASTGREDWRLVLRVTAGGLVREDGVHQVLDGSAVPRLGEHAVGALVASAAVTPEGFTVRLRPGRPAPAAEPPRRLEVTSIALDSTLLTLGISAPGVTPDELQGAVLQGEGVDVPVAAADPGRLVFDLVAGHWGLAPTVLPRGGFRLVAGDVAAVPGGELRDAVPLPLVSASVRVTARMRPTGVLGLLLAAPLTDAERSPVGRQQLRALPGGELDQALVLLQCGEGVRVDGDPLALDAALARLRPGVRRLWAVQSLSLSVPEGAEAVVVGTRAWHDALRTAGTIISDSEIAAWFEPAAGQRWLVTGEGHPAKAMGAEHDRLIGRTPGETAAAAARRNRAWSALLAGSPEAERLYRDVLDYDGTILTLGQPSTDPLLRPGSEARRAEVRGRLGIDPDETVVLYAPTYRDATADRVRSAPLPRSLDLGALRDRSGVTVLLRAHLDDAPDAAGWARAAGVVDVTAYPWLADLLLAADVAILDYSAIRFDWAVLGRPAICFVPDRVIYESRRRPLIPYEETAPGPIVTTTDEVVALLGDLPALRAASGPMAAAVRHRFAPLADGAVADRLVDALF